MAFTGLVPNLMVENVRESIAFYSHVLGFSVVSDVPHADDPSVLNWAMLDRDDVNIMLQARASFNEDVPGTTGMPVGASLTFYLSVTDLDALVEEIRPRVTVVQDVHQAWYGAMEFYFRDPNGYIWCISQPQST